MLTIVAVILVAILSALVNLIIQSQISNIAETGVEPFKDSKVFKFIFGSPEAVGTTIVVIVGLILMAVGATSAGADFIRGSVIGFAGYFLFSRVRERGTETEGQSTKKNWVPGIVFIVIILLIGAGVWYWQEAFGPESTAQSYIEALGQDDITKANSLLVPDYKFPPLMSGIWKEHKQRMGGSVTEVHQVEVLSELAVSMESADLVKYFADNDLDYKLEDVTLVRVDYSTKDQQELSAYVILLKETFGWKVINFYTL